MRRLGRWVFQNAVAADRQINALLGGSAEETMSSRAYRMRVKGVRHWRWFAYFIDLLFWWQRDDKGKRDHCQRSHRHQLALRGRVPGVGKDGKPECLWAPLDQ